MTFFIRIGALLLLLLIAGCGSQNPAIVGKWRKAGAPGFMDFSSDGTVALEEGNPKAGGRPRIVINYSFPDANHIRLQGAGKYRHDDNDVTVIEYSLSGDLLIFQVNQQKETWERVK